VQVHNELGLEWNKDGVNVLEHLIGSKEYVQSMLKNDLQRLQGIATRLAGMSNKQAAFRLL